MGGLKITSDPPPPPHPPIPQSPPLVWFRMISMVFINNTSHIISYIKNTEVGLGDYSRLPNTSPDCYNSPHPLWQIAAMSPIPSLFSIAAHCRSATNYETQHLCHLYQGLVCS